MSRTIEQLEALVGALNEALPDDATGGIIIAGGAVRDTLMGREVKDIDLLIDTPITDKIIAKLEWLLAVGFEEFILEGGRIRDLEMYDDPDRKSLIQRLFRAPGYDLIQVADVYEHVEDFPDNISKAYIDTNGTVTLPEFDSGHALKDIVYRDTAGGDRLQRLLAKYDYTVTHV